MDASNPDDIRASGWMVAVHNDYRVNGELFTFWLFTKEIHGVLVARKGEGRTDGKALNIIRRGIGLQEKSERLDLTISSVPCND